MRDKYGYDFEPSGCFILDKKTQYFIGPDSYHHTGKCRGDAYYGEELSAEFKHDRTGKLFWFCEDVYTNMRQVKKK